MRHSTARSPVAPTPRGFRARAVLFTHPPASDLAALSLHAARPVYEQTKGFSIIRRKWDDFLFCFWTAG